MKILKSRLVTASVTAVDTNVHSSYADAFEAINARLRTLGEKPVTYKLDGDKNSVPDVIVRVANITLKYTVEKGELVCRMTIDMANSTITANFNGEYPTFTKPELAKYEKMINWLVNKDGFESFSADSVY